MNSESTDITAQLRGIKQALYFGAGCLFIMAMTTAISDVYYMVDDARENKEAVMGRTFYDQGAYLATEKNWEALLALAKTRQRTHPMDPHAFGFAGIAHYRQERWDDAITSFRKAVKIQPSWKKFADNWVNGAQKEKMKKTDQRVS